NRGDVKLLSTALKELRYAFKIFAPYRNRRKVAVFGSARLAADHPAVLQAVEFSRRIAEAGHMVITGAAGGIMEAGQSAPGRQKSKRHLFPVVMVDEAGGTSWKRWAEYVRDVLLARKLISPADMSLFAITESVEGAVQEVLQFYRVYQSMRYVRNDLVLRLQHR